MQLGGQIDCCPFCFLLDVTRAPYYYGSGTCVTFHALGFDTVSEDESEFRKYLRASFVQHCLLLAHINYLRIKIPEKLHGSEFSPGIFGQISTSIGLLV